MPFRSKHFSLQINISEIPYIITLIIYKLLSKAYILKILWKLTSVSSSMKIQLFPFYCHNPHSVTLSHWLHLWGENSHHSGEPSVSCDTSQVERKSWGYILCLVSVAKPMLDRLADPS
jgi:hypothetical protein